MKRQKLDYALFVTPALTIMTLFFAYPIFITIYFSLLDYSIVRHTKKFVGIGNYLRILTSDLFIKTSFNTLVWVVISTFLPLIIALVAALLTYHGFKGKRFFTPLFSLPLIFIPSSTAILWALMYSDPFGLVNHLCDALGLQRRIWLGDPATVLPAISLTNAWYGTPMTYLMLLAGLESLPLEPIEASGVDGASLLQKIWYILLPMLWPIFSIVALLRLIDVIRSFALIWMMSQGGPGTASLTLPVATFKVSFLHYDYGAGSAWGIINVILCLILSLGILFRRREV